MVKLGQRIIKAIKLEVSKLLDTTGKQINPATEDTLAKRRPNDYDVVDVDLGTARDNVAMGWSGIQLQIIRKGGTFSLRFNSTAKPEIRDTDLADGDLIDMEFTEVYLTNSAQAGVTLRAIVFKRT